MNIEEFKIKQDKLEERLTIMMLHKLDAFKNETGMYPDSVTVKMNNIKEEGKPNRRTLRRVSTEFTS